MNDMSNLAGITPMTSLDSQAPSSNTFQMPLTRATVTADQLLEKMDVSFAVGEGDEVEGKIKVGNARCIVINGVVKGDIETKGAVIVMKSGRVLGNIVAGHAWIEGEVANLNDKTCKIEAGTLHIGQNSLVIADCYYDQISIDSTNRGVRGRLESRQNNTGASHD